MKSLNRFRNVAFVVVAVLLLVVNLVLVLVLIVIRFSCMHHSQIIAGIIDLVVVSAIVVLAVAVYLQLL